MQGMSLREAYEWVQARRPIVAPNVRFHDHLVDLEQQIRGETSMEKRGSSIADGCDFSGHGEDFDICSIL